MITIQKATPAEAKLIADIAAKSYIQSHGTGAPAADIALYVSKNFALYVVEEELNNHENIFHIIYYKGHPVGYSKIVFNKSHPLIECATVTKLERLYLLQEFYGLKLGLTLFEFIIDLSKKSNQDGIWLCVWTKNQRALTFYKRSGFEIIGSINFKISETHSNPNYIMYHKY